MQRRAGRSPLRLLRRVAGASAWLLLSGGVRAAAAQDPAALEYRVKAAYLLNFTRYIQWPPDQFASPEAPLTICVLGSDPFGGMLDSTLAGRVSQGRVVAARRIRSPSEATGCALLFITRSEWHRDPDVLRQVPEPGVVTVGESEEFARQGGVLAFVIQNETVRFAVNLAAQNRAQVRISSRMVSLASAIMDRQGASP